MKIYLVRHTEYENPKNIYAVWLPFKLSKLGKRHAKTVAEYLAKKCEIGVPITASPIERCQETAKYIAKQTKSKIETDKRLIEVYSPGLQGKTIPGKNDYIFEEGDPKRERRTKIRVRMLSIFNEKIKEGKDCILVSHGDPIVTLYYHLSHLKLLRFLWNPKNPNLIMKGEIVEIDIENGEVIKVERIKLW